MTFLVTCIGILIVLAIVCEAITELIGASELFSPLRRRVIEKKVPVFSSLFQCKYCLSVWVAAGVVASCGFKFLSFSFSSLIVVVLTIFLVHRLSNWAHVLFDSVHEYRKWRWAISIGPTKREE